MEGLRVKLCHKTTNLFLSPLFLLMAWTYGIPSDSSFFLSCAHTDDFWGNNRKEKGRWKEGSKINALLTGKWVIQVSIIWFESRHSAHCKRLTGKKRLFSKENIPLVNSDLAKEKMWNKILDRRQIKMDKMPIHDYIKASV